MSGGKIEADMKTELNAAEDKARGINERLQVRFVSATLALIFEGFRFILHAAHSRKSLMTAKL